MFKTLEASDYFGTFIGNFAAAGAGYCAIDTILTALMVLFTGAALFVAWRAWKISKAGQYITLRADGIVLGHRDSTHTVRRPVD